MQQGEKQKLQETTNKIFFFYFKFYFDRVFSAGERCQTDSSGETAALFTEEKEGPAGICKSLNGT